MAEPTSPHHSEVLRRAPTLRRRVDESSNRRRHSINAENSKDQEEDPADRWTTERKHEYEHDCPDHSQSCAINPIFPCNWTTSTPSVSVHSMPAQILPTRNLSSSEVDCTEYPKSSAQLSRAPICRGERLPRQCPCSWDVEHPMLVLGKEATRHRIPFHNNSH
jgi:hypothetical protein